MFKQSLTPYFIGFEILIFTIALSILFAVSGRYKKIEANVNKEVNHKSDVSTTFKDYEVQSEKEISGASVITEIKSYDGSLTIAINSEILNDVVTPTGDPFFVYIKKYDDTPLMGKVVITSKYLKRCLLDQDGELVQIEYTIV